MNKSFPASIMPVMDLAPTLWLNERVRPVGRGSDRVMLHSVAPGYFPAYCRILHPAYIAGEYTPVRWSEVAARNNKVMHPQVQFGRLAGSEDPYAYPSGVSPPFIGELPEAEANTISKVLRNFTSTPDNCYLLVWEGYGGIQEMYPITKKLELPGRSYLVYTGPMESVLELCIDGNTLMGPNIWWPEDRAWVVATEIDFLDTYVGGSARCVNQLLGDPDLEAFPAFSNDRVDFFADTINVSRAAE